MCGLLFTESEEEMKGKPWSVSSGALRQATTEAFEGRKGGGTDPTARDSSEEG